MGTWEGIRNIRRREQAIEFTLLLLWILPQLLFTVKPGLVRNDGYRQLLFSLPAMVNLAADGVEFCANHGPPESRAIWIGGGRQCEQRGDVTEMPSQVAAPTRRPASQALA
jgi:hypothetical protein